MEEEILKLIHKYKQMKRDEPYEDCIALDAVIADFNELLRFKQKNCCGNFIIEEVARKRIESAAYNRGHHDGYMQLKIHDRYGGEL